MPNERDGDTRPQYPWSRGWDWINKGAEMFFARRGRGFVADSATGESGSVSRWCPTPVGPAGWMLDFLLEMVGLIVGVFFDAGLLLGCDAVRRGEPLRIGTLFAAFRHPAARG